MKKNVLLLITLAAMFTDLYSQASKPQLVIDKQRAAQMASEFTNEGAPGKTEKLPVPIISFAFDKESAIYNLGEEALFSITIKNPDSSAYNGKCFFRLTEENSKSIKEGSLEIVDGKAEYKATNAKPGFLRLYITADYQGRAGSNYATAGLQFCPVYKSAGFYSAGVQ